MAPPDSAVTHAGGDGITGMNSGGSAMPPANGSLNHGGLCARGTLLDPWQLGAGGGVGTEGGGGGKHAIGNEYIKVREGTHPALR